MEIAFFEVNDTDKRELSQKFKGRNVKFYKEILSSQNVSKAKTAQIISIFIYSKINKDILSKLPNLKLIATRSTGYDHIDLKECKKRGIKVCNVPAYGANTVAEHAFALILDLSRNVRKAYLRAMGDDFDIQGLKGFDLKGKTMGVVGVGNIGKNSIKIANGFGMNVIASDPHHNKALARKLKFKYASFKDLLKKSDIVTLHVPLIPSTKHLMNKKTIAFMKPNALLINTSRGGVVDTNALLHALEKNKLGGAGLDVIEGEKEIKEELELLRDEGEHVKKLKDIMESLDLLRNDKVVFTPHIAFYSTGALGRLLDTSIDNIKSFIKGKPKCLVS